jgi:sec-independent protein translocase protein TatA
MPGLDSPTRWLILIALVVVLFGYKKLPEVTRSVGRSLRIFKTEMKGLSDDDGARDTHKAVADEPAAEPSTPAAEATSQQPASDPTPPPAAPEPSPNGSASAQQPTQPTTPGTV